MRAVWSGLCLLGWLAGAAATLQWVEQGKIQTWNFSNNSKPSQVFKTENFNKEETVMYLTFRLYLDIFWWLEEKILPAVLFKFSDKSVMFGCFPSW